MSPTRSVTLAAASFASALLAGCATTPLPGQPLAMRPPEAPVPTVTVAGTEPVVAGPGFTEQGKIQFTPIGTPGASAAWDARSVRGPAVNLTLTDEGLWGGTLRNRPVLLRAAAGRITGEGVNVYVRQEGPVVHIQGTWFGALLRIDVSPTKLSASPTSGVCSMELAPGEDGYWRGFGGCGGRLTYTWMTLSGVAGDPSAEMPQWLFAFLASLPSPQTTVFPSAAFAGAYGPGPGFLPASMRGPAGNPFAPPMPCSPWNQAACGPLGWNPAVNGWFGGNGGGERLLASGGRTPVGAAAASSRTTGGGSRSSGLNRGGGTARTGGARATPAAPAVRGDGASGARGGSAEQRGAGP